MNASVGSSHCVSAIIIPHLQSDQTGHYMSTYIEAEGLLYFTLRSDFDTTLSTLVKGDWLKKKECGEYVFLSELGDEVSESEAVSELMMIEVPDSGYRNLLNVIRDVIPLLDDKSEFSYFTTDGRFEIGRLSERALRTVSDNEQLMEMAGDTDDAEAQQTKDNFILSPDEYQELYDLDWMKILNTC